MSLFVRVDVGFWAHRKTMRLRAVIGDCALWLPLRLWSYAAQNQPDGDFKDYQADELAMLLGYSGNAQAMLEAFQQSGFMDGMQIHDWKTYNGYHSVFAERAKKAAAARWGKERKVKEKKRDREEKRREEASIASSNGEASPSNASSIPTEGRARGTVEEITAFCVESGHPAADGAACFHKWVGNGWKNNGEPIKCWKSTIRSWAAAGYLPSQKNAKGTNANRGGTTSRNDNLNAGIGAQYDRRPQKAPNGTP